jgi:hypothetical protein
LNVPVVSDPLAFMLQGLIKSKEEINDQLSLGVKEVVSVMPFDRGDHFGDDVAEETFLFC